MDKAMEKLVSPDRALELVLGAVPPARSEQCTVDSALGRTLAEMVYSPQDFPPFARSMMDGFAVRVKDAASSVPIAGLIAAGHHSQIEVEPGTAVEIMTGAACPATAEAVVPVEQVQRQGQNVLLPKEIRAGQHIEPQGQLCKNQALVLSPGARITPLVLGVLAAFGRPEVTVFAPPRVAVVSTGDELVGGSEPLAFGKIRDSNGPMLEAMLHELGVHQVLRLHAHDNEESLAETLARVESCELVLFTGGVSMGRFDLVPKIVQAMGATPLLHKVVQKPGKPLFLAAARGRLLFGLPGNARSTHLCFHQYVAPALRKWMGRPAALPEAQGVLTRPLRGSSELTMFIPALAMLQEDGSYAVAPCEGKSSADIFNTALANAYVRLRPGQLTLAEGALVRFSWLGDTWLGGGKVAPKKPSVHESQSVPEAQVAHDTASPEQEPKPPAGELTHLDEKGQAHMVDVGEKPSTYRVAVASARLRTRPDVIERISQGKMAKGDVLATARIAGIMAAKRTHELIPLCHSLRMDSVQIELTLGHEDIDIRATVSALDRTGVEMEAMTAASVAALTLYDMCKAVDRKMTIEAVRLEEKSGGKSGHFVRTES